MSKKIIHIIDSLGIGGAEQVVRQSVENLTEYKHFIVVLNEPIIEPPSNAEVINLEHQSKIDFFFTLIKLRKLLSLKKPDLIHTHLFWSTTFGRFASSKKDIVISTYHSLLFDRSSKQFSWKMLWLEKLIKYRSSYNVYVSEQVEKMYLKNVGVATGEVIPNFFHPKFKPESHTTRDTIIRVVAVGNNRHEKDYQTLFDAMQYLPDHIHLFVYGRGFENISMERVAFMETLDINKELTDKDIFVSTSVFEGFGIAVIEAMAKGLPCVITDIDTYYEIGEDNVCFFKKGDSQDLAAKISELCRDFELRKSYAIKALTQSKKFELQNYLLKLRHLYTNLING